MLSIIISSYQPNYYDQLVKNIDETIGNGFMYEIIPIWNPGLMNITKAYNLGAERAKFDYYLFLHEDTIFHTQNWGEKLITHLNQPNTGIVGIAGSSYVPAAPCSWTVAEKYNSVNLLQGNKKNTTAFPIRTVKHNRNKVFAIDGVFMGIKKENFIKFNEDLEGFHGYDLDFSLRSSRKFQNYVIDDILIQHFSGGNLDKAWLDANIKVKKNLGSDFNLKTDAETEKNVFEGFLYRYFDSYPVSIKNIFFTLKFYPLKKLDFKGHLILLKKYLNYLKYSKNLNENLKKKL